MKALICINLVLLSIFLAFKIILSMPLVKVALKTLEELEELEGEEDDDCETGNRRFEDPEGNDEGSETSETGVEDGEHRRSDRLPFGARSGGDVEKEDRLSHGSDLRAQANGAVDVAPSARTQVDCDFGFSEEEKRKGSGR